MPTQILPLALIVAIEVSAKGADDLLCRLFYVPAEGVWADDDRRTGPKHFTIGLIISTIFCYATLGILGLACLAASQIAALYMVSVAKRNFGGATGDGIGASNEVCRIVALAAALALGGVLPWMQW